jgi:hypothetical protein
MLVRRRQSGGAECIMQAHHALLSGVLAAAWGPTRLDPLLVQAIGLHDDPWRDVDTSPSLNRGTGWPHDFLTVPLADKVQFYREGIDRLESVHPFVAYLVSRHYTTFAGTHDVDELVDPEAKRQERLESRLSPDRARRADRSLEWMKYFDVWSLYLCLAGPLGEADSVPSWLAATDKWLQAPDGTEVSVVWRDDTMLEVEPFVFGGEEPRGHELGYAIEFRYLDGRLQDDDELDESWSDAPVRSRDLRFVGPQTK